MVQHCPQCGIKGQLLEDTGATYCMICGSVIAQDNLTADIAFGESSSGAAIVQGSYVANNATGAAMSRPGARQSGTDSREVTLANGKKMLHNLAANMGVSSSLADSAARWFNLAVAQGFTKGRKGDYVIAACLYVACRKARNPAMLIDFSDKMQVNVFELGSTYLKFVRKMAIKDIPLVDPSIYISRFAALLEFGDDTHRVAQDATRLAARFERDWMQTGRRPSGICGACLILAARMNNFRRSIAEVVQVVKIADITLRKRLKEFQATKSGSLTVDEFRKVWLEESEKPPAMLRNEKLERERIKALAAAAEEQVLRSSESEPEDVDVVTLGMRKRQAEKKAERAAAAEAKRQRKRSKIAGARASSMAPAPAAMSPEPREATPIIGSSPAPEDSSVADAAAFASLQGEIDRDGTLPQRNGQGSGVQPGPRNEDDVLNHLTPNNPGEIPEDEEDPASKADLPDDHFDDPVVDEAVAGEIADALANERPATLAEQIELAEQRRLAELSRRHAEEQIDELKGLDEEELDGYLLTAEQVEAKTKIWNTFNRDYMIKLNERNARLAGEADQPKKAKRKRNRIGPAASAQEAAVNLVRTKKFSRKINYGNIAALLADDDDDMVDQSKLRRMASMSVQPRSDNEDDKGHDESGKDDEGENYQDNTMDIVEEDNELPPPPAETDGEAGEDDDADMDPFLRAQRAQEDGGDDTYYEEV